MKRRIWGIFLVVLLIAGVGTVAVIGRNASLDATVLEPRAVLSVNWGSGENQVAYKTVQADGWMGPSTFAVTGDLVYIVDRINREIKVFNHAGAIVNRISMPEEFCRHPDELEVIGDTLFLTYYDIDKPHALARYANGTWSTVDLSAMVPGFVGWFQLSRHGDRLVIRRDIPPEDDHGNVPRWAVIDERGKLVLTRTALLSSPDEQDCEPHLLTPDTGRQSVAPPKQEIALVNPAGQIVKRGAIDGGAATNVITMLKDDARNVFVQTRTLSGELDRWTTYLTVYGPDLEIKARCALRLPAEYRDNFAWPSSDVGRTELVAQSKYYEMLYLKDRLVILEWNPLGTK